MVTFLANLETFFVRVVTFSISLSMYFLHPDGISITDPRTLKPSHCNICAFEHLYGAFSAVFLFMS